MNYDEIISSVALKKQFCKDYDILIGDGYDNPKFERRLFIVDELFDSMYKFDNFCTDLKQFENDKKYFEYYNSIKNNIINYIKRQPEFNRFVKSFFEFQTPYYNQNVYTKNNDNTTYLSVKFKISDFSILKHWFDSVGGNIKEWEDVVGIFTQLPNIIKSKHLQRIVLDVCNPDKLIQYKYYLMSNLLNYLINNFANLDVYSINEDEILIRVNGSMGFPLKKLYEVVNNSPNGMGNLVKVEMFNLHKIKDTKGWAKCYYSFSAFPDNGDKFEFINLDNETRYRLIEYLYTKKNINHNFIFAYDNRIERFLNEMGI